MNKTPLKTSVDLEKVGAAMNKALDRIQESFRILHEQLGISNNIKHPGPESILTTSVGVAKNHTSILSSDGLFMTPKQDISISGGSRDLISGLYYRVNEYGDAEISDMRMVAGENGTIPLSEIDPNHYDLYAPDLVYPTGLTTKPDNGKKYLRAIKDIGFSGDDSKKLILVALFYRIERSRINNRHRIHCEHNKVFYIHEDRLHDWFDISPTAAKEPELVSVLDVHQFQKEVNRDFKNFVNEHPGFVPANPFQLHSSRHPIMTRPHTGIFGDEYFKCWESGIPGRKPQYIGGVDPVSKESEIQIGYLEDLSMNKIPKNSMTVINQLANEIHENAKSKGFFDGEKNIGEMLCLIHSEVSEALEADRKGKHANMPEFENRLEQIRRSKMSQKLDYGEYETVFKNHVKDTFEDELADVFIRVLDLCAFKGIDIEAHVRAKMAYNAGRPHKHGKKY